MAGEPPRLLPMGSGGPTRARVSFEIPGVQIHLIRGGGMWGCLGMGFLCFPIAQRNSGLRTSPLEVRSHGKGIPLDRNGQWKAGKATSEKRRQGHQVTMAEVGPIDTG